MTQPHDPKLCSACRACAALHLKRDEEIALTHQVMQALLDKHNVIYRAAQVGFDIDDDVLDTIESCLIDATSMSHPGSDAIN